MSNKGAMAEYIERGALLASKQLLALSDHDRAMAKAVILGQPTADVVSVVRCKDCEHYGNRLFCYHSNQMYLVVHDEHYCSLGLRKRKDGADNV